MPDLIAAMHANNRAARDFDKATRIAYFARMMDAGAVVRSSHKGFARELADYCRRPEAPNAATLRAWARRTGRDAGGRGRSLWRAYRREQERAGRGNDQVDAIRWVTSTLTTRSSSLGPWFHDQGIIVDDPYDVRERAPNAE